jgi:hypothetical protein
VTACTIRGLRFRASRDFGFGRVVRPQLHRFEGSRLMRPFCVRIRDPALSLCGSQCRGIWRCVAADTRLSLTIDDAKHVLVGTCSHDVRRQQICLKFTRSPLRFLYSESLDDKRWHYGFRDTQQTSYPPLVRQKAVQECSAGFFLALSR